MTTWHAFDLKRLIFLAFLAILVIAIIAITYKTLISAPEFQLSEQFIINNKSVIGTFGNILSITPDANDISYTSSTDGLRKNGIYGFNIAGSKQSGKVEVEWESTGGKFCPKYVYDTSAGDRVLIWKSEAGS